MGKDLREPSGKEKQEVGELGDGPLKIENVDSWENFWLQRPRSGQPEIAKI